MYNLVIFLPKSTYYIAFLTCTFFAVGIIGDKSGHFSGWYCFDRFFYILSTGNTFPQISMNLGNLCSDENTICEE